MRKLLALTIVLFFACSSVSFAKVVKTYYPNGGIKYVARYNSKNQLNGPYTYYWPNGKVKEQGRYKNGEFVGRIKKYSPAGVLLGRK